MLVPQFYQWSGLEHSLWGHGQGSVPQGVKVAHDEQEIGGLLHGQEPGPGHVDAEAVVKALHGGTNCCLQLQNIYASIERLGVDYDFHLKGVLFQNALHGWRVK